MSFYTSFALVSSSDGYYDASHQILLMFNTIQLLNTTMISSQ